MPSRQARRTARLIPLGLMVVVAGLLPAFDVDNWQRYSVWLIAAAAFGGLRVYLKERDTTG